MARHSHWAQIKLKKGALDKKRGKIFTRHARLIEIAARIGGGNPAENPSLRFAIDNARADNIPKENIERAIKKGTGELNEGNTMAEAMYEGFGPGGAALLIETLTDNKNRTNQSVRNILEKHGGKLGAMGSVSFLFEKKGVLSVAAKRSADEDELAIIDAGAEDIEREGGDEAAQGGFIVYTKAVEMGEVKKKLEAAGFSVRNANLEWIAKDPVSIPGQTQLQKLTELLEALDEEEDVSNIFTNTSV